MKNIKSYFRKRGRITNLQKKSLEKFWHTYGISVEDRKIKHGKIFTNNFPIFCEIGFGMGDSLLNQAIQFPNVNFIGIDIYQPGIGSLLHNIKKYNLTNIRIYCHDAVEVFEKCIPDNLIQKLQLFFPDPWPKKKHTKRRIIQKDFINLITKKVSYSGYLHIATDSKEYMKHILKIIKYPWIYQENIQNIPVLYTLRFPSKFEKRGKKMHNKIYDIIFILSDIV